MELSGISIQDLSTKTQLSTGDMFLGSRSIECVDAYESIAIDTGRFMQTCISSAADIKIGTAANMPSSYFAPISHKHDHIYNRISVEQLNIGDSTVSVGNVQDDGGVYRPIYSQYVPAITVHARPEIGTLKFLAVHQIYEINENSDDFNGWCWADGRQLSPSVWRDAFDTFGYNYTAGSQNDGPFNIPDFQYFLRPALTNDIKFNSYSLYLPEHMHYMDVSIIGNINISMELSVCNGFGYPGTSIHAGKKEQQATPMEFNQSCNHIAVKADSIGVCGTINSSGDNQEAYPAHKTIPVLIYIGHKQQ